MNATFASPAGGLLARSRRRLRLLMALLAVLLAAAAAAALLVGRPGAAVVALLVAGLPLLTWRMSGDLEPVALELEDGVLTVVLRRGRERLPLAGASARQLTADEVAHLARLIESGGLAAGSGGFDSSRLGEFDLYASDLERAVLLEAGEQRLVLTPEEPERFLAAVRAAAAR